MLIDEPAKRARAAVCAGAAWTGTMGRGTETRMRASWSARAHRKFNSSGPGWPKDCLCPARRAGKGPYLALWNSILRVSKVSRACGMFRRRQFLRRVQVIALTKDVTGRGDHVALLERIHACNRDAPEFS